MHPFFFLNFYFLIYFWLHWVLVAVCELSLVAVTQGSSPAVTHRLLLWSLLLQSIRSRAHGLQQWRHVCSVVVTHGLGCPEAYGIFLNQGSNPCPLSWQADSQLGKTTREVPPPTWIFIILSSWSSSSSPTFNIKGREFPYAWYQIKFLLVISILWPLHSTSWLWIPRSLWSIQSWVQLYTEVSPLQYSSSTKVCLAIFNVSKCRLFSFSLLYPYCE